MQSANSILSAVIIQNAWQLHILLVCEREIYSHTGNAGNQKGLGPSKLAHITNIIILHKLEHITQNIKKNNANRIQIGGKGDIERKVRKEFFCIRYSEDLGVFAWTSVLFHISQ